MMVATTTVRQIGKKEIECGRKHEGKKKASSQARFVPHTTLLELNCT